VEFGEIATERAAGTILAHGVRHGSGLFKKGRVLSEGDVEALKAAGVARVFAARLGPDDVPEDAAAAAVAEIAGGTGTLAQAPFTGRANLHASAHGLALVDVARINRLNRLHESLTFATVAHHAVVAERQLVATVKVIPFAVPRDVLAEALSLIGGEPLIRVEPFRHRRAGLIITRLPQTKATILAKSEQAVADRLRALGGELAETRIVDHAIVAVREAIAALLGRGLNPVLVFGASAIVDRGDVIPAALAAAGGEVVHLGMPVDPGNLLMYGRLDGVSVIGVPSCARSPKLNGFDWILERVMAGVHVGPTDIMDMGAGGLLAEIASRPSPREVKAGPQQAPRIAAIVLAAGLSRRMGANKLLANLGGTPLVRRTVERALGWPLERMIVVTGHEAQAVRAALAGLDVDFIDNPDHAQGLSTSLRRGIAAVPGNCDGALVVLGDMPLVEAGTVKRLVAAFAPAEQWTICVPSWRGQRGNPVLWGRSHFEALVRIEGDAGARGLMAASPDEVVEIEAEGDGVTLDADTPEALARLRSRIGP
jgi:molybdenum cofactor cytidylyltransferase